MGLPLGLFLWLPLRATVAVTVAVYQWLPLSLPLPLCFFLFIVILVCFGIQPRVFPFKGTCASCSVCGDCVCFHSLRGHLVLTMLMLGLPFCLSVGVRFGGGGAFCLRMCWLGRGCHYCCCCCCFHSSPPSDSLSLCFSACRSASLSLSLCLALSFSVMVLSISLCLSLSLYLCLPLCLVACPLPHSFVTRLVEPDPAFRPRYTWRATLSSTHLPTRRRQPWSRCLLQLPAPLSVRRRLGLF